MGYVGLRELPPSLHDLSASFCNVCKIKLQISRQSLAISIIWHGTLKRTVRSVYSGSISVTPRRKLYTCAKNYISMFYPDTNTDSLQSLEIHVYAIVSLQSQCPQHLFCNLSVYKSFPSHQFPLLTSQWCFFSTELFSTAMTSQQHHMMSHGIKTFPPSPQVAMKCFQPPEWL